MSGMEGAALLFPPLDQTRPGDWRGYPSIPLLKRSLKRSGISCREVDLNHLFLARLVRADYVTSERTIALNRSLANGNGEPLSQQDLHVYLQENSYITFLEGLEDRTEGFSRQVDYTSLVRLFPDSGVYRRFIEHVNVLPEKYLNDAALFAFLSGEQARFAARLLHETIENLSPPLRSEFIGISVPSIAQYPYTMLLCLILKQMLPGVHICLGGPFVTLKKNEELEALRRDGVFDTYCKYVGDRKIVSSYRMFANGRPTETDGQARPDDSVNIESQIVDEARQDGSKVRLLLSRSCYWGRCAYCDYTSASKAFRIKKTETLVAEIEHLNHRFSSRSFQLVTDALPPGYVRRLAPELRSRFPDITWSASYMRVDSQFDTELFDVMKTSGFQFGECTVGVDSLSDQALALNRKGYRATDVERFLSNASASAIVFGQVNVIPDLPGTDVDEALAGLTMLSRFAEVIRDLAVFPFQLTSSSQVGNDPGAFGIQTLGTGGPGNHYYANALQWSENSGLDDRQRKQLIDKYRLLSQSIRIAARYPSLKARMVFESRIYDLERDPLLVRMPSRNRFLSHFDWKGNWSASGIPVIAGSNPFIDEAFTGCFRFFSLLEANRWYSIGAILRLVDFPHFFERDIYLQLLFSSVKSLLACGYFRSARWLEKGPASQPEAHRKAERVL